MLPKGVRIVEGNLLDQPVEAIVNPWNRNLFPWWLLLPQGVSGAIKKRGGLEPFRELRRMPMIPLGGAVHTSAGSLPFKRIIHVAGINLLWRAGRESIRNSVVNAVSLAESLGLRSLAFPVIGAGSGGFDAAQAESIMREALNERPSSLEITIVRFRA
jgi:O-acetyl-ADP-ribose deacetylase (regulator of RNase III)